MVKITARYRIATPMFCGGANQSNSEFRLPSFKGALQFWWRAIAWNEVENLTALRKLEARVWGSSSTGQSSVRMHLGERPTRVSSDTNDLLKGAVGYLAYGLGDDNPERKRHEHLVAGQSVTVHLMMKDADFRAHGDLVLRSLKVLGLLGGMGSKSRKGLGSLSLAELTVEGHEARYEAPATLQAYAEEIRQCLGDRRAGHPPYSAWSESSRVVAIAPSGRMQEGLQLLEVLAATYRDAIKETHPTSSRVVFGLPRKGSRTFSAERRASPILLHVHHPSERSGPLGAVTLFPGTFLPGQDGRELWGAAANALNSFRSKNSLTVDEV